jgi:MATE family multidrug resistance protein
MFIYKKHHLGAWPERGWSWSHHTRARTREFLAQAVPNVGTALFEACTLQVQTILVGRMGGLSIAAASVLYIVASPWARTIEEMSNVTTAVRIGYHLGKGDWKAARQSSKLVILFITVATAIMALVFLLLGEQILMLATDDVTVLALVRTGSLLP